MCSKAILEPAACVLLVLIMMVVVEVAWVNYASRLLLLVLLNSHASGTQPSHHSVTVLVVGRVLPSCTLYFLGIIIRIVMDPLSSIGVPRIKSVIVALFKDIVLIVVGI